MTAVWSPRVTVATLVERNSSFLFVREHTEQGVRINQPAGHWEANESLLDAAKRETLEETGWDVTLTGFVSAATFAAPDGNAYLRFTFVASPMGKRANVSLDPEILEVLWLTRGELELLKDQWRSPLVGEVLDQYLSMGAQPLELVSLGR
ncbi:NUDIX domain-containing protein [Simiduia aestuariiviva]|uniref:8-oxo-dGTP pyrophosphatase MutT (NUDIX family) n=1 Tax=Simiduia aestuariiviva TaxID=1510459 RepID=A0A839UJL6_9GAMM|nr:NUDIX domain-containing protein [Simiduia aestuariiviva]MBB3168304.1 8-oxo-dGTP pyrophosphatase MutT (NUDIX family) [Simiduia aestuariiviva]